MEVAILTESMDTRFDEEMGIQTKICEVEA